MKPIIAWFVDNPVAANLLMVLLVAGGLVTLPTLYREELPDMQMDMISVEVAYPMATAEEIESSVCVRLEENLSGLEGVKKTTATASLGKCVYQLELYARADKLRALREVKNSVDKIDSFPEDAERPIVTEVKSSYAVLQIAVSGSADEHSMKHIGERMERELLALPEVSQVSLAYTREAEISIEISELALREHHITLAQVADVIRSNSLDLPGGEIKTHDGQLLIRTQTQGYWKEDFADLVVLAKPDGTRVKLGEIATIVEGFRQSEVSARFDGERAIIVDVRRIGDEDIIDVAEAVKAYIEQAKQWLPPEISLEIWQDESMDLVERMRSLTDNALSGLLLIIVTLTLFMRLRLAFWVTAGIPIALLGATLLFPVVNVSISTVSIIAVLLVLGIVVDDAVVVGERVHALRQQGLSPRDAAVRGAQEMSVPVFFGVLTTIVTFIPLMHIPGTMGSLISPIGCVGILVLVFSLIEALFILPAHLRHQPDTAPSRFKLLQLLDGMVKNISGGMDRYVEGCYRPLIHWVLRWRYSVLSASLGLFVITIGVMLSGRLAVQFFPAIPGERVYASVTLPQGTSLTETERAVSQLERAVDKLRKELDAERDESETESRVAHVMVSVGRELIKGSVSEGREVGGHFIEIALALNLPEGYDGPSPTHFANRWRELAGPVPNAVKQTFDANMLSAGNAVEVQLRGDDLGLLSQAAEQLKRSLYATRGVIDIHDSFEAGKQEIMLTLLPEARSLGITAKDLAFQVRQAFYGEEVQRIQRGSEEVKIVVRYPESERNSLGNLELMRIRTPDGVELPFTSVAKVRLHRGLSNIVRIDGSRVVNLYANVEQGVVTGEEVLSHLQADVFPELELLFPGLDIRLGGEAESRDTAFVGLVQLCVLALFLIYALLAIPLKSYLQPVVVMSVIPFGMVGSVYAHILLDEPFVFFSILGVVALSGVVVNASLALVDKANRLCVDSDLEQALVDAACERFKPIILTSFTTFIGLIPLIASSTLATMLFVPMAISLAGGVLFSTFITLILVPTLYRALEDRGDIMKSLQRFFVWLQHNRAAQP